MRQAQKELLVEGADDVFVLVALFQEYKLPLADRNQLDPGKVSIRDGKGVDSLKDRVRLLLKPQDEDLVLQHLGIIVDSDAELMDRWRSLRDILVQSGYINLPVAPYLYGTIIEQVGKPRIGIWLMPDNRLPGMLEDFIKFLVPPNDTLWDLATRTVDAIPEHERLFSNIQKGHIHTWLAWQKDPGKPIGQAISLKFLDPQVHEVQILMQWIKRLFDV